MTKPPLRVMVNKCPKCGLPKRMSAVLETRPLEGEHLLRRRYKCNCGHKYTTYEVSGPDFKRLRKDSEDET